MRSCTQLGIHARPETATDPHNVVRWIERLRADGFDPDLVVLVVGSNDVGYAGGTTVAANAERIRAAMRAIGDVDVVWTTISHPKGQAAWNEALRTVAGEDADLHVCDWATELAAKPWYLTKDKVHMTYGPNGGYVAMAQFVQACVRLLTPPPPPPPPLPTTTSTTSTTSTTTGAP